MLNVIPSTNFATISKLNMIQSKLSYVDQGIYRRAITKLSRENKLKVLAYNGENYDNVVISTPLFEYLHYVKKKDVNVIKRESGYFSIECSKYILLDMLRVEQFLRSFLPFPCSVKL